MSPGGITRQHDQLTNLKIQQEESAKLWATLDQVDGEGVKDASPNRPEQVLASQNDLLGGGGYHLLIVHAAGRIR